MTARHRPKRTEAGPGIGEVMPSPRWVAGWIPAAYDSITEAEQQVADAFETEAGALVNLPVKELARRVDVSDATVIRFAQSLGFAGLREVKNRNRCRDADTP